MERFTTEQGRFFITPRKKRKQKNQVDKLYEDEIFYGVDPDDRARRLQEARNEITKHCCEIDEYLQRIRGK
jgi:hypothetical protein